MARCADAFHSHHTLVLSCSRLQLHLECLGNYYHNRYGLDFRSLRFPGVLSASAPGGGTTDYVLDMYFEAHKYKQCTSFLSKDIEVRQSPNYYYLAQDEKNTDKVFSLSSRERERET